MKEYEEAGCSMDVVEGHGVRGDAEDGEGCGGVCGVDWADCGLEIVVSHSYACRSCLGVTMVASVVEDIDPWVYCMEMWSKLKETGDN